MYGSGLCAPSTRGLPPWGLRAGWSVRSHLGFQEEGNTMAAGPLALPVLSAQDVFIVYTKRGRGFRQETSVALILRGLWPLCAGAPMA